MPLYVLTMMPSPLPKNDLELKARGELQEIRNALQHHGGESVLPILMGDAVIQGSSSCQKQTKTPMDILITKHKSIQAYYIATQSDDYQKVVQKLQKNKDANDEKNTILTVGFYHNTVLIDWVYPALRKLFQWVGAQPVDCTTKSSATSSSSSSSQTTTDNIFWMQANGNSGLENYKRKINVHPQKGPAFVVQLSTPNDATPEGRAAEKDYMKAWLQAAFSYQHDTEKKETPTTKSAAAAAPEETPHDNNEHVEVVDDEDHHHMNDATNEHVNQELLHQRKTVDIILGGKTVSLDQGPKVFGNVTIFQYPTRELYVSWMESDYFSQQQETLQASVLDQMMQVTLPLY